MDPDRDDEDQAPSREAAAPKPAQPTRAIGAQGLEELRSFKAMQRQLAGLDLSAVRAVQRDYARHLQSTQAAAQQLATAQEAIAEHVRRSIDMSGVQALVDQVARAHAPYGQLAQAAAESIARSFDISALEHANESLLRAAEINGLTDIHQRFLDSVAPKVDLSAFTRKIDRWTRTAPGALLDQLDRWIPENLRNCHRFEELATISLDEGLPLSWVPRPEIVEALLDADDEEGRAQLLTEQFEDILDDCRGVLDGITCELGEQSRIAVEALAAGFEGPAQSHASNIIDSIVLALGEGKRPPVVEEAQVDVLGLPMQVVSEALTLRPLFKAFVQWFPAWGTPPPAHFARHATSHAVGYEGLFGKHQALIAVMLSTSMTRQYWDHPGAPWAGAGGQ